MPVWRIKPDDDDDYFKPRLHQGNMLPGNMLPWCKRGLACYNVGQTTLKGLRRTKQGRGSEVEPRTRGFLRQRFATQRDPWQIS